MSDSASFDAGIPPDEIWHPSLAAGRRGEPAALLWDHYTLEALSAAAAVVRQLQPDRNVPRYDRDCGWAVVGNRARWSPDEHTN